MGEKGQTQSVLLALGLTHVPNMGMNPGRLPRQPGAHPHVTKVGGYVKT